MAARLLSERHGAVLVLRISNPEARNAMHPDIYRDGAAAMRAAADDAGVRAIVLTGEGEHFCAGGNLNRLRENRTRDPSEQAASIDLMHAWVSAIRDCPKPVIAAVEGAAAGAGFSLVLACDLVVAADDARFVMSYGRVGLTPDGGGSWQLAQRLPRALALQLIWLAEPVGAAQLQQWGLVNQVVPAGQALAEALRLTERLARMAPNALAGAKELVDAAPTRALRAHLDDERERFVANLFHRNGLEGLGAFLEKRTPDFR